MFCCRDLFSCRKKGAVVSASAATYRWRCIGSFENEGGIIVASVSGTTDPSSAFILRSDAAAAIIAVGGGLAIMSVYFFQYVVGLAPCPLCLEQRIPYYLAIPVAVVVALIATKGAPVGLVRLGFALLVVILLVGAGLGVYHAGIEWKFWLGPTECTGELKSLGGGMDLMKQIQATSVVRCDEAAWRFLGISLAGYNVLASLALAVVAATGFATARTR